MPSPVSHFILAAAWLLVAATAHAVPVVWSGLTFTFIKPAGAPLPPPADQITQNVALTRGSSMGLYNAERELGYNGSGPTDTEWATDIINPGKMIAATNWQALTFGSWLSAYGGGGQVGHQIEGRNAVVHLITDDIYLDLRFSHWGSGFGDGSFTYTRAVAPTNPVPTGDYNGNGRVDAADYTVWRDTLGEIVAPFGSGADGDQDGLIANGDFTFWKQHFGEITNSAAAAANSAATPEPPAAMLALAATMIFICRWSKSSAFSPG